MTATCYRQDCPGYGGPAHWHSSALGNCVRKEAYAVLGYSSSDPRDPADEVALWMGQALEPVIFRRLEAMGYQVERPLPPMATETPFPRVGRPDGAIITTDRAVADAKALKSFAVRELLRVGLWKAQPGYGYQTLDYALSGGYSPERVWLGVLDKGTNRVHLIEGIVTPDVLADYYGRLETCRDAFDLILSGELPEREYDGSDWHCNPRWCEWSSTCWGQAKPQARPSDGGGLRVWEAPEPLRSQLAALAEPYLAALEDEDEVKERVKAARADLEDAVSGLGFSPVWWPGLTGSQSDGRKTEEADKAFLRSVLTPEQYARAFSIKQGKPYWTFKRTAER